MKKLNNTRNILKLSYTWELGYNPWNHHNLSQKKSKKCLAIINWLILSFISSNYFLHSENRPPPSGSTQTHNLIYNIPPQNLHSGPIDTKYVRTYFAITKVRYTTNCTKRLTMPNWQQKKGIKCNSNRNK